MGTNTARVEVLTAEVRVMMVGSRQVTQTMFSQLDQVPIASLRGRVWGRVSPREEGWWVVGVSEDGSLVKSLVGGPGPLFIRHLTWEDYQSMPLIVLAGLR